MTTKKTMIKMDPTLRDKLKGLKFDMRVDSMEDVIYNLIVMYEAANAVNESSEVEKDVQESTSVQETDDIDPFGSDEVDKTDIKSY